MKILQSLASCWDDIVDVDALQVIRLKGAMTNEVYQIKWPTNSNKEGSRKVLVRIYGEGVDVFFDREMEIRTFEFMSKQGQGPRLLGRFSNGRIEEFIRARVRPFSSLVFLSFRPHLVCRIGQNRTEQNITDGVDWTETHVNGTIIAFFFFCLKVRHGLALDI